MSMIGCFRRMGASDLERLLGDPDIIIDYIDEEDTPDGFGPFADFDVDKAWHGIHYLLTQSGWGGSFPASFILAGGSEIGEDLGYGPARGFTPEQVKTIAKTLEETDLELLKRRYDTGLMTQAEIYPDIWEREGSEGLEFLLAYYEELRQFVAGAAADDEALLVYLS